MGRGIDFDGEDFGVWVLILAALVVLVVIAVTALERDEPTPDTIPPPVYSVVEPVQP